MIILYYFHNYYYTIYIIYLDHPSNYNNLKGIFSSLYVVISLKRNVGSVINVALFNFITITMVNYFNFDSNFARVIIIIIHHCFHFEFSYFISTYLKLLHFPTNRNHIHPHLKFIIKFNINVIVLCELFISILYLFIFNYLPSSVC